MGRLEVFVYDSVSMPPFDLVYSQIPHEQMLEKTEFRRSSGRSKAQPKRYGQVGKKIEQKTHGAPDAQSDRRGPPTDRPPDKPPPWKGAVRGSSYDRSNSRHAIQLASSRGTFGLSGNVLPLEKSNLRVKTPSNQSHALAAGSSRGIPSVGSWRHPGGRRSRVNGYVCGNLSPSPNLGRNLFPPRRFSCSSSNQRVQWHSVTTVTSSDGWQVRAFAPSALCALVRCSPPTRWGQTK
jgi:hypothetical protein